MKPKLNFPSFAKSSSTFGTALALCLALGTAHADVTYQDFEGGNLDGAGLGASVDLLDEDVGVVVNLITAGIIGQDGSEADGVANVTDSTGNNDLGVNSVTNVGNYSSQARDFNPGEAWIFKFDVDVELVNINFAGFGTGSEITLSSTAFANDQIITDGDDFSLGNTLLPAGTEVRMEMTSGDGTVEDPYDTGVRLDSLTVSALPPVSTGANLRWTGDSDNNWNTTDLSPSPNNWDDTDNANADSPFATDDNVTIDMAAAITVDAGGITAGDATVSASVGETVSFSGGNLTTSTLTKSGASLLAVNSPVTVDSGVLTLSEGALQVTNGATLNSSAIALSGGSTLQIDSGGVFTSSSGGALSTGGAILQTEEPVSIGILTNDGYGTPFTKTGSGALTFTGNLGAISDFPVKLDVLAGSVTATNGSELHISGPNTFDGDVFLDSGKLELHATDVSGTGSINILSGGGELDARFQFGAVNVANTINISPLSTLTAVSPANGSGNSELHLNGPIIGDGNVLKEGNGLVVLAGTNTYTGSTTINAGILQVGDADVSGSLGTGPVTLGGTGTLEFRRDDAVVVDNVISGAGNISFNGGAVSSFTLTGLNDYVGVTTLFRGTLSISVLANVGQPSNIGIIPISADDVLIRGGGVLSYTGPTVSTDLLFAIGPSGGGGVSADGTGPLTFSYYGGLSVPGTGSAARTFTLGGDGPGINTMAPSIPNGSSAPVSVEKTGTTTWLLDGTNTYTGDTIISNGTLMLGAATDITDSSAVRINGTTSILQLTDGVTDTVNELYIDGVQMIDGTWGTTASGATNQDDVHFSGTGMLSVTTGPSSNDYDTWAAVFLPDDVSDPAGDYDNDSLTNHDEYAFGLDPTSGSSSNPISVALDKDLGTFSYTRRDPAFGTDLDYTIWTSTDLSSWTPDGTASQTPGATDGEGNQSVEVTLTTPPTAPKFFIRVTAD